MHCVHPRTVHYSWKQRLTFSVSAQTLSFLAYLCLQPKNPLLSLPKKLITGTHLSSGRELWNSHSLRAKSEWRTFDRTDPRPVIQSTVCPQNLIRCLMHDSLWITQFSKGGNTSLTNRLRKIRDQHSATANQQEQFGKQSEFCLPCSCYRFVGGKRSHQPFTSLLISTGGHAVKHF